MNGEVSLCTRPLLGNSNFSGWLFLPVSLIGQPFSQKTRDHFIPLLTSKQWWQETTRLLHALFDKDDDFQERMFAKQLAVLKGQSWNILETLKQPDQGPLELCRRQRVLVNDEEMEVPVAVPMTVPTTKPPTFHEEMDISSLGGGLGELGGQASSAPPPQVRLTRTPDATPTRHIGDPMSSSYHSEAPRDSLDDLEVPDRLSNLEALSASFLSEDLNRNKPKPYGHLKKTRYRMSYEGPSRPLVPTSRRRGYSVSETGGLLAEEDEEERDLGYDVTAQDEDTLRRKVIVEQYFPQANCTDAFLDLRLSSPKILCSVGASYGIYKRKNGTNSWLSRLDLVLKAGSCLQGRNLVFKSISNNKNWRLGHIWNTIVN